MAIGLVPLPKHSVLLPALGLPFERVVYLHSESSPLSALSSSSAEALLPFPPLARSLRLCAKQSHTQPTLPHLPTHTLVKRQKHDRSLGKHLPHFHRRLQGSSGGHQSVSGCSTA